MNDLVNAHELLVVLDQPHRGGHHCPATDTPAARGSWVPFREECGPRVTIKTLAALLDRLHDRVHAAAHDDDVVDTVAEAMLAGTPLATLSPEVAEGWRYLARTAIETLSMQLDLSGRFACPEGVTVRPIRYGNDVRTGDYAETCPEEEAQAWAVYRLDAEGHEQWVSDHLTKAEAIRAAGVH